MLKGTCENKKCNKVFYGWALKKEEYLTCVCGNKLTITAGSGNGALTPTGRQSNTPNLQNIPVVQEVK